MALPVFKHDLRRVVVHSIIVGSYQNSAASASVINTQKREARPGVSTSLLIQR
jgi:hypothetical protein